MKKYEINRMAVLVDVMAECLGSGTDTILGCLEGVCISEEESGEIRRIIEYISE